MNLPPVTKDDRRAVPRHIRDGEHDMMNDTSALPEDGGTSGPGAKLWIYVAVMAAAGIAAWYFLR